MPSRTSKRLALAAVVGLFLGGVAAPEPARGDPARPNFLIIVADDLGFSDLGIMGSEIRTPHIDALAKRGLVLTNFHVSPTCSPTRAMLLTGVDSHRAGLGTMRGEAAPEQQGRPGYEGVLAAGVPTLAERLREAGYRTFLAGKWHLGREPGQLPTERGFDHAFGPVGGGATHFSDGLALFSGGGPPVKARFLDDGKPVDELPDEWFSTDGFTDRLLEWIEAGAAGDAPFLALATYTAPHWPLQAPPDYIDRYRGAYDAGWDVLRARRMHALRQRGLVAPDLPTPERVPWAPAWKDLDSATRARHARIMEVYAAMVEHLDHNVGRLLAGLQRTGALDDTLVLFFSDNGAEGNPVNRIVDDHGWVERTFDNRLENIGRPGSYVFPGPGWAQASSMPFHLFKGFPTQGGIRTPAIAAGREVTAGGSTDAFVTVKDVMPTLLAMAGLDPATNGADGPVLEGASLAPLLDGRSDRVHPADHAMGWELFGRRAIRVGNWKASWLFEPYGAGRWRLFDLAEDPTERRDLAREQPQVLERLLDRWNDYATVNRVVLPATDAGYALEDDWR